MKGARDRYVPVPQHTLEQLRRCWASHRNPVWLFPASFHHRSVIAASETQISGKSVWRAFRDALQASGIQKRVPVHTLRHCYSTHLLENGINMRLIQSYLGHHSMRTSIGYTHMTRRSEELAGKAIDQLMADLS